MSTDQPVAFLDGYRIVDLSTDLSNHANGPFVTSIEVFQPTTGAGFFCDRVLPMIAPHAVGVLTPDSFPDGAFLRHEFVTASTHAGSHVDAPGHYGGADLDGGTIGDAPLSLFVRPGFVLDLVDEPDDVVEVRHLDPLLDRISACPSPIVLVNTGGNKAISAGAVDRLIDLGVHVVGTDGASFDGPFERMIDAFIGSGGDTGVLWPTHVLGRTRPYYQLERLSNLDQLPQEGFLVVAVPVLVGEATAAWSRVFALVPRSIPQY